MGVKIELISFAFVSIGMLVCFRVVPVRSLGYVAFLCPVSLSAHPV